MKVITLVTTFLILLGCSSSGLYQGVQTSKRNECLKLPQSQYDECMKNATKSYDEYERERKEATNQ